MTSDSRWRTVDSIDLAVPNTPRIKCTDSGSHRSISPRRSSAGTRSSRPNSTPRPEAR